MTELILKRKPRGAYDGVYGSRPADFAVIARYANKTASRKL